MSDLDSFTLNTWGFMWFHPNGWGGGLPNDFLDHGIGALLLFDRVIVDADAFECEMLFADRWTSSGALMALKRAGLIECRRLRDTITPQTFEHLKTHIWPGVHAEMTRRLTAIHLGHRTEARMFPELQNFNHVVFEAMDIGAARYDWREGTLAAIRASPGAVYVGHLIRLIRDRISVIPMLSGEQQQRLKEVVRAEEPMLHRWMFGDPAVDFESYNRFRRDDAFLRAADAFIDSEGRRELSLALVDTLVAVRRETTKHRAAAQRLLRENLEAIEAGEDAAKAIAPLEKALEEQLHYITRLTVARFSRRAGQRLQAARPVIAGAAQDVMTGLLGIAVPGLITTGASFGVSQAIRSFRRTDAVEKAPLAWIVTRADEAFRHTHDHHHATHGPNR